jgi:hypothetical protein
MSGRKCKDGNRNGDKDKGGIKREIIYAMNQSGMKYTRGWEKVRREPCAYFSLRVRFFSAKVAVA